MFWHSIVDCLFAVVLLWHPTVCLPAKVNDLSISSIISSAPAGMKTIEN